MSDTMSPGDITQLALSDEVAFRVRFAAAAPPEQERYWRGPVLHNFDGRTWRSTDLPFANAQPLQRQGPAYQYTVMMEPHQHKWIFALDWPAQWDLEHAGLNADYTLVQDYPLSRPVDVLVTSYSQVRFPDSLSESARRRETRPPDRNPRTMQLARELRTAHPDDMEFVGAVLAMFTQQPFYYTLSPPKLGANPVDEFLFGTKRGFCEHYASAFAVLARA